MQLQGRQLNVDTHGEDVNLLHQELKQLGFDIHENERADSFFGPSTELVVRTFQRQYHLEPTGIVDERTAVLINQMVEENQPQASFVVRGRVMHADGKLFTGGLVRAYDKDLRSEELLGTVQIDNDGGYEITYSPEQFGRAEKATADLRISACTRDGSEVASSPILFNAGAEETINLVVGGEAYRGLSEYERLVEELTPLLQDLSLAELTEDKEHQDITFLSGETGRDPLHIALLIKAHRLMQTTEVTAEIFYGLFREGLPTALPALLAQSPDVQRRGLVRAASNNIIPPRFGEQVDAILDQLKRLIVKQAFESIESDGQDALEKRELLDLFLGDMNRTKRTVLSSLSEPGSVTDTITNRLQETLKVNLLTPLAGRTDSLLAQRISEIERADLISAKDITLTEFAERNLKGIVDDDRVLREEYEQYLNRLPKSQKLGDILHLDQPFEQHPFFAGIVKEARIEKVLTLTSLKEQDDRIEQFKVVLNRCGGLHAGFWKALEDKGVVPREVIGDIKLSFDLTGLGQGNVDLARVLKTRNVRAIRDLISLHQEDWLNLLRENQITPPESFKGEQALEDYAASLESSVAERCPTEMFFNRLFTTHEVDACHADLICVEPFLRANRDIALEWEISFLNVRWHTDDVQERNRVKRSIENLRRMVKLYSQLGLSQIANDPDRAANDKMEAIKGELAKLGTFLENNPKLDLHFTDFHRGYCTVDDQNGEEALRINWEGVGESDQKIIRNQLMVYQRLFRIRPSFKVVQIFLESDFDSAHKITQISENQFLEQFAKLSDFSTDTLKTIYSKALGVTENTIHQWANVKDAIASPAWKGLLSNNVTKSLQQYYQSFQSYQDMFGSLSFYDCPHCQSIFSPAAYFVDLMRFSDLNISTVNKNIPPLLCLRKRRLDLWKIPLDCANTNTLVSYMDLVNGVLEYQVRQIANKDPYEALDETLHPFNLPFNLPLEEMRVYLSHFGKDLSEIYEAFEIAETKVACEYLSISPEERAVLTIYGLGQNDLATRYGVGGANLYSTTPDGLARIKTFLRHTGLNRTELNDLLFQDLSEDEKKKDVQSRFFINNVNDGLGPLQILMDVEIGPAGQPIPFEKIINISEEKLNNIHRFVRLARKVCCSFADLDWVLWSLGDGTYPANINDASLTKIAKIKMWHDKYNLPIDVLCSFWSDIKDIGRGNSSATQPLDLFDRLFNRSDILKGQPLYDLTIPVTWNIDQPDDKNRNRLLAALELSNEDLDLIARHLTNANILELNRKNLPRLYRFSKIPKMFSLSVWEFIKLLSLMRDDGSLGQAEVTSLEDFLKLVTLVDWFKTTGLSVYELDYILTQKVNPFVEYGYTDNDIRLLTEELSREFKSALIVNTVFMVIAGVDEKQSKEIFDELIKRNFLANVSVEGKAGGRLTDTFAPELQNFSFGLPLLDFEKQVIEILKQHDIKKIVLKRLGTFYGVEPDMLKSAISFASQKLDDAGFLDLLSTPIKEDQTVPPKISGFMRPIHAYLFLVRKLSLSRLEIDSIIANPEYYNIVAFNALKIKDILSLHTFKQFTKTFNDTSDALLHYFEIAGGVLAKPQKIKSLSALTGWNEDEIGTLFKRFWPGQNTDFSHIDAVQKLAKCFDLSLYMGVGIGPLTKWTETANGKWVDYNAATRSALEILKAKYSEMEWEKKYEPLADRIRTLKRDGLAAYAIWKMDVNLSIENLRDLYAYLLIDVEMASCAKTSRIAQGIATLQLYIQRCQMNLEPGVTPECVPTKQWEWMKNYRVWEANRKVFLYPENYIEPELRDDKSPIFKELEEELLQSEVTSEAVEKAYRNYLNKFAELANLKTAGSYYDTGSDTLYLFGRTNTQPYTYHYRTYNKQSTWTPWVKVDLSIKSEYASPIFAFNRLFIFWVEFTSTKETEILGGNSQKPTEKHKATIKYSFHDFNKNWWTPQTLIETEEDATIAKPSEQFWKRVYPVVDKPNADNEQIVINYGGQCLLVGTSWFPYYSIGNSLYKRIGYNLGEPGFASSFSGTGSIDILGVTSNVVKEVDLLFGAASMPNTLCCVDLPQEWDFNPFLGASYPLEFRPLASYHIQFASPILDKTSDRATIEPVNDNSREPAWHVYDNGDEEFLIKRAISEIGNYEYFTFKRTSTQTVEQLSQRLFEKGPGGLLSVVSQNTVEPDFERLLPNKWIVYYPFSDPQLDFNGAYGLYYWEVFFHTPFLVADRLNSDQKFADTQKWYHYIYNPTIQQIEPGEVLKDPKDVVWRFLRLRELTPQTLKDMLTNPAALAEYRNNPFKPHAIARLRPTAYQKALVMKYIDNLLDWGDNLFAQDTVEAINEATMLYVLAYNLLGPRPEKLGTYKPQISLTFENIENKYKQGSLVPEFLIELENSSIATGVGNGSPGLNNYFSFYFCVPENEEFIKYWDRVESSLYKIRHCMNIKGVVRQLELFSPPINPMALVQAVAAGRDISSVLAEISRPVSPYRFNFMLEKSKSLCASVQQLGAALLSVLEKKDAEELALLRSTHEKNILQLTTKVREKQRDEAIESYAALLESKAGATTKNKHYKNLLITGQSPNEVQHLDSMQKAWVFEDISGTFNLMASLMHIVPNVGSPMAMTFGGRELGAAVSAVAQYFKNKTLWQNLASSMSSTLGSYERRAQEWVLQEQISQHDIDQIGKQIAVAELRKQITEQEMKIHEKYVEQNDKAYEFMRDKFSNKDLYKWMQSQLSGLYFQTYKMAYDLAKSTERAYQYERDTDEIYLHFGHWDSLKQGLLSGERLMLELNQLEKAYLDDNARNFEIEKTISLAQLDPKALISLKTKGSCEFNFNEAMYEFDFPGHYCRKIKTIAISIPAIVGPYENIKATLTQTSHRTLLQPDTTALLVLSDASGNQVKTVQLDANSVSVRSNWIKNQQIAISRGINDSGIFELNFRDERYLPFEGTGAVSDWKLEMPKATNRIDFDSISDVIIHLKYTAKYDWALQTEIQSRLTNIHGWRILILKHEFSTNWYKFMNPDSGEKSQTLKISVKDELFPRNAKAYQLNELHLKVDLKPETLPIGSALKLAVFPAKANKIEVSLNKSDDTLGPIPIFGGSAFGEWIITVNRKDGIPEKLRRKKNGNIEIEVIGGENYYYLDPEQFKNIGLLLYFQGKIDWSTS